MIISYKLRCRKRYKKAEFNCKVVHNGKQKCSFNVRKTKVGYVLTPFENVGCGVELSVSLDRIVREAARIISTGKCDWKPPKKKGEVPPLAPYGEFQACLMEELRAKLKETGVAG